MHQHHASWQDTCPYDAKNSNERNCVTIGGIMAASPSPTVRRKRLGIELRRLREQADLTCEDVGHRLDCSGTRISRIETGRISIRPGDVRELLDIYGVTGAEADVRAAPYPGSADDIDRQIALRMERQNILVQPSPPDLWLVLTESVVRVQVGGPPVMRSQLRRLIDV